MGSSWDGDSGCRKTALAAALLGLAIAAGMCLAGFMILAAALGANQP